MRETIGIISKLLTGVKLGLKEEETAKEIDFLSKLISVGLSLDNKVTEKEKVIAKEILEKELLKEDSKLAWNNILIYLDKYNNESTRWEFANNKNEVINYIIETKNYQYAKFLSNIIESDDVSQEEEESHKILKKIIVEHERLLEKKKLI